MQPARPRRTLYKNTKRCLVFFLFFTLITNSSFAVCEIGDCNNCLTLKSKCACVAMTYFQYFPLRHHNYKDSDDYEYVRLASCEPDVENGIRLIPQGKDAENEDYYKCTFKYIRHRSCTGHVVADDTGKPDSCKNTDKVITVQLDMKESRSNISFDEVTLHTDGANCQPSTKEGSWVSYNLHIGDGFDSVCFDRCTTSDNVNAGVPGMFDKQYPLGTLDGKGVWCMVYGDLYKKSENGNDDSGPNKTLKYDSNDDYLEDYGKEYTFAYCSNNALAKFIDPIKLMATNFESDDDVKTDIPAANIPSTVNAPPFVVPALTKVDTSDMHGIGKQSCDAGNVYTDGQCTPCVSKPAWVEYAQEYRMYCPGIQNVSVIGLQIKDQIKKCPNGAFPNADLTDCECGYGLTKQAGKCVGSVSEEYMYYGPEGKNAPLFKQCWTKVSEKAYKKCMGFDN